MNQIQTYFEKLSIKDKMLFTVIPAITILITILLYIILNKVIVDKRKTFYETSLNKISNVSLRIENKLNYYNQILNVIQPVVNNGYIKNNNDLTDIIKHIIIKYPDVITAHIYINETHTHSFFTKNADAYTLTKSTSDSIIHEFYSNDINIKKDIIIGNTYKQNNSKYIKTLTLVKPFKNTNFSGYIGLDLDIKALNAILNISNIIYDNKSTKNYKLFLLDEKANVLNNDVEFNLLSKIQDTVNKKIVTKMLSCDTISENYISLQNPEFGIKHPVVFYSNKIEWLTVAIISEDFILDNARKFIIAIIPMIIISLMLISFIIIYIIDSWFVIENKIAESKCNSCHIRNSLLDDILKLKTELKHVNETISEQNSIDDTNMKVINKVSQKNKNKNIEKLRSITTKIEEIKETHINKLAKRK